MRCDSWPLLVLGTLIKLERGWQWSNNRNVNAKDTGSALPFNAYHSPVTVNVPVLVYMRPCIYVDDTAGCGCRALIADAVKMRRQNSGVIRFTDSVLSHWAWVIVWSVYTFGIMFIPHDARSTLLPNRWMVSLDKTRVGMCQLQSLCPRSNLSHSIYS